MITINQCNDNNDWAVYDRLCFQIFNGKTTTYIQSDSPDKIKILASRDVNRQPDHLFNFYYKEEE